MTDSRRAVLADFLRLRRAALAPESVGLHSAPRRRARGLLREEVAALAEISVEWYTRIERGVASNVTPATQAAIGRALRLSPAERAYVGDLLAPPAVPPARAVHGALVEMLQSPSPLPMIVATAAFAPFLWNAAARRAFRLSDADPPLHRHPFWRALFDPRIAIAGDRNALAAPIAGLLRRIVARSAPASGVDELVAALRASPAFRSAWESHVVDSYPTPERFLGGAVLSMRVDADCPSAWRPLWLTVPERPEYILAIYAPADATGALPMPLIGDALFEQGCD